MATPAPDTLTPVMRQYTTAKEQHPDALLFFRLGDFYELFFEDAITASRELQLTLTSRDKSKSVPMCGVPYHAAETYLQRLLRKGYRVALCEQLEDAKATKTIVRREVTRVLTPGTALDPTLSSEQNNFLAALHTQTNASAVAVLDLSTGDFRTTEFTGANSLTEAIDELNRLRPIELLIANSQNLFTTTLTGEEQNNQLENIRTRTPIDDYAFTPDYALPLLRQHLKTHSLDGFGLAQHDAAATAAGALLHYLRSTKQGTLEHIDTIRYYERSSCLELDAVSVRNLELTEPLFANESQQTTLAHTLDNCCTPMGKRLLRANLLRPLVDLATINARLDAVAELTSSLRSREQLRRAFDGVLDLERLLSRVALDSAGPRDLLALGSTIACLPTIQRELASLSTQQWKHLANLDTLADLHTTITTTLTDDPPLHLSDGNVIREGIDAELDELRTLSHSGRQSIAAIEDRERKRTGINSLKVRFNNVFGYYIELTKSNLENVPADYQRKQTLVNAERFTTPELKEYEVKILTAQDRSAEIERRLFADLRATVLAAAPRIRKSATFVAEADLLANFAHLAAHRNYTRPIVLESNGSANSTCILEFLNARHPVVEQRLADSGAGRFIPNSLSINPTCSVERVEAGGFSPLNSEHEEGGFSPGLSADVENRSDAQATSLLLITGPNMGGKSTYLRQSALLVIMAQIGSFVPADKMTLGLVDRIYTRIGASDNVARGRSTFMVEMTETAAILNTATPRSLVLLDEMGRGTATYDGLSLAWAAVEHLHNNIGCRTLFATHYHELTLLASQLPKLRNLRVTVKETPTGIVFLHTVEPGPASKSYGIEVARLAGLPQSVINRAREVLKLHERAQDKEIAESTLTPSPRTTLAMQMTIFTPLTQTIVDRLQSADLNALTPIQAMNLLAELKQQLPNS